MTYDEAIDYLLLFADFERTGRFLDRPDVGPMRRLLRALGEPQDERLTVHVAGTKGKGSISAMLDAILRAAGNSCGLYTSPHLHDYTERVRIDGEAISRAGFARLTAAVHDAVVGLDLDDRGLVTFDLLTAIGFQHQRFRLEGAGPDHAAFAGAHGGPGRVDRGDRRREGCDHPPANGGGRARTAAPGSGGRRRARAR